MSGPLTTLVDAELADEECLERLVASLVQRWAAVCAEPAADGWMVTEEAARYLGISRAAPYRAHGAMPRAAWAVRSRRQMLLSLVRTRRLASSRRVTVAELMLPSAARFSLTRGHRPTEPPPKPPIRRQFPRSGEGGIRTRDGV
jgi:hypothetical protein